MPEWSLKECCYATPKSMTTTIASSCYLTSELDTYHGAPICPGQRNVRRKKRTTGTTISSAPSFPAPRPRPRGYLAFHASYPRAEGRTTAPLPDLPGATCFSNETHWNIRTGTYTKRVRALVHWGHVTLEMLAVHW